MNTCYKIGLTGGIGAGKSTASACLAKLGAYVLDADYAAREVVLPGTEGLEKVIAAFGDAFLAPDGTLNRNMLARLVFADPEQRKRLESIVHPLVLDWFLQRLQELETVGKQELIVLDIPLLIECGWHTMVDEVWLVTAPEQVRIARICKRDHCSAQAAAARIASQMSQEEKRRYAARVFDNGSTLEALYLQLEQAYATYVKKG